MYEYFPFPDCGVVQVGVRVEIAVRARNGSLLWDRPKASAPPRLNRQWLKAWRQLTRNEGAPLKFSKALASWPGKTRARGPGNALSNV
jgi:hypothetical protein